MGLGGVVNEEPKIKLGMWLLLFAAIARADGEGVYDDGTQFEAPGVEDSSLESHRTRTHDEESGTQYNFVEQAAQEQRQLGTKGPAGGKTLSDLLAGGAEVEVVDLKGASSGLHDLIKQMFAASSKPSKPKPAALPSVPPDTPVSQLLQMIRQTTHDIPSVAPQPASPGRSSVDAGEASEAVSYLDHMDGTGLELLEEELLQKVPSAVAPPLATPVPAAHRCESLRQLRRVRAAKERRALRSGSGSSRRAPVGEAAPRQASPTFETADEAAPAARATSLSDALSEALGLKPKYAAATAAALGLSQVSVATARAHVRSSAQLHDASHGHTGPCHDHAAAPSSSMSSQLHGVPPSPHHRPHATPIASFAVRQQAAGSGASADDDGVDSYAKRLNGEAQQRERSAGEGGEEAEGGGTSIQDLLQQMIGGDGPVVKFEVVMGDGSEFGTGGGGGGGLSGLLESLKSQMEGDGDDDEQEEEEEEEEATDAL